MPIYVEVVVNVPQASQTFIIIICPAELEDQVQPGCLVVVPFGQQQVQGVVCAFCGYAGSI